MVLVFRTALATETNNDEWERWCRTVVEGEDGKVEARQMGKADTTAAADAVTSTL